MDTVACIMETSRKCIYCKEVFRIVDKLDELDESGHVHVGRASRVRKSMSRCLGSSDCPLQRS